MTDESPEIRPATAADLRAFYGTPPAQAMRAYVAVLDGNPIAVAGLRHQGPGQPPFFFSEIRDEMRRFPKAIVKGARLMLASLGRQGLVAVADPNEHDAPKFLSHLGFRHVATLPRGEIYEYQKVTQ